MKNKALATTLMATSERCSCHQVGDSTRVPVYKTVRARTDPMSIPVARQAPAASVAMETLLGGLPWNIMSRIIAIINNVINGSMSARLKIRVPRICF